MNFEIQYHKWTEKEYKNLNKSIRDLLKIESLQFYIPIFSLYFYLHNKSKAIHKLDLKRNYYLKEITEIAKSRYYNSNMFLKGNVYNECKNITIETELFCKSIPIVDPIHCINNNYNFVNHSNYHLPSNYNYNTFHKINNIDSNIIEELIEKRNQARKDKNFNEADNIRLKLNNMGIEIEDTKHKTVWRSKN